MKIWLVVFKLKINYIFVSFGNNELRQWENAIVSVTARRGVASRIIRMSAAWINELVLYNIINFKLIPKWAGFYVYS